MEKTGTTWFGTVFRALGYLTPHRMLVCVAAAAALLMTLAQLSLPWLMKTLFDILTNHGDVAALRRVCALVVVASAITVLCDGAKIYLTVVVSHRILIDVRNQVYAHLRRLPFAHFQAEQTGKTMSVLTSDAPTLLTLYSPVLDEAFLALFQLAVTLAILVMTYGWLTLLVPAAVVIYLLVPVAVASPLRRWGDKIQTKNAELSADLQESLSGTREIKVFNRDIWDRQRLERRFRGFLPAYSKIAAMEALAYGNILLYWIVVATLYAIGGKRVLMGGMSLGSLVALIWYIGLLDDPLRRISGMQGKLQTALSAATRIFEVLDTPAPPIEPQLTPSLPRMKGQLRFENVSFSYVENSMALSGVSFSVSPGQRLAIAGKSGAGKTTLVNLIPRLHDVTSGRILIDGVDIRSVSLESLRGQIGILFQDVFLFNTSIRENIRLGRLDATDEEIVKAAQLADAHDFTMALPQGYETLVGERGLALSGGQKQRIAIARVILLDPGILILDEATSALDSETELTVRRAIERMMRGRTVLVIEHHLSTLGGSDSIVMLENGNVVGVGTHAELIRTCKQYQLLRDSLNRGRGPILERAPEIGGRSLPRDPIARG